MSVNWDEFILSLNAITWFLIFLYLFNKYGIKNIGVLYFGFYTLISVFAIHYYLNNSEGNRYVGQNIFFHVYLLIFIFLFCYPLIKSEKRNRKLIISKRKSVIVISVIVSALSLIGILDILTNFYQGIFMLAQDESYGASLYHDLRMSMDENKSGISNYMAVATNIARSISPLFFFIYLSFKKRNKLIIIALFISSISVLLHSVSVGSRSAIIDGLMSMAFMLMFMWKYYDKKIKKFITPFIGSLFVIISAGFIFISFSRSTAQNTNPAEFLEKYLAISPLNFGKYGLDNGEIRYGDRTAPLIKSFFCKNVARTYKLRLEKYRGMKINESTFTTFVGDFVFDYGIIGGSLIMIMVSFLLYVGINSPPQNRLYINQIVLIYILISILNGYYLYPMSDYLGNLRLITLVCVYIYFLPYSYANKKR